MKQSIAHIALVVNDYDEAIKFYTEKLNFMLLEDTPQSDTKRWVLIAPKVRKNAVCCWLKRSAKNKEATLEIKRAGEFFFF